MTVGALDEAGVSVPVALEPDPDPAPCVTACGTAECARVSCDKSDAGLTELGPPDGSARSALNDGVTVAEELAGHPRPSSAAS
jgi:hypothetical protein